MRSSKRDLQTTAKKKNSLSKKFVKNNLNIKNVKKD